MRILLLPYENDFNNYIQLYKTFSDDGHEVSFLICDFFSPITGNDYVKKSLIQAGVHQDVIFDLKEELFSINTYDEADRVCSNYEYLNSVEDQFVGERKLAHLIYSDIYLCGLLHSRDNVYRPKNKNILYVFIEKIIKKVDLVLDKTSPDVVCTFGSYNFVKNYVYERSLVLNIKHLSLLTTRINNLCLWSHSSCFGPYKLIKDEMDRLIASDSDESFTDADQYIESIKIHNKPAYDLSSYNYINDLSDKFSFWYQIKPLLRNFLSLPRAFWNDRANFYRGLFKNNYFYLKSVFYLYFLNVRNSFRNRGYFNNEYLNHTVLPQCDYIFYSLQTLPEDVGFTQKDLTDEFYNIMRLSKVLPVDCKIVIKVHSTMLIRESSPHSLSWYNKINEIHNTYFVSPLLKGIDVVKYSKAVAAVSSTTLLEAVVMGKPAFCFGNPEFEILDGVFKFSEERFVRTFTNYALSKKNNHKYYIQAVFNKAIDIEYDYYMFVDTKTSESIEYKEKYLEVIVNHFYCVIGNQDGTSKKNLQT